MATNLTTKLLKSHLVAGQLGGSEEIALRVDQVLLQDATGTMSCLQYLELAEGPGAGAARGPVRGPQHDPARLQESRRSPIPAEPSAPGTAFTSRGRATASATTSISNASPARAQVLIGADSHTTTSGAVGMIAIGAGGLEVAVGSGGRPLRDRDAIRCRRGAARSSAAPGSRPRTSFSSCCAGGASAAASAASSSFTARASPTLSVAQRGTICNMIAELGATTGLFPSDERTREWLRQQRREDQWVSLAAGCGRNLRRGGDHRALGPRAPHRQAVQPGQRGSRARGRRDRGRPGLRGQLGQLRLRGPGPGRGRARAAGPCPPTSR